MSGEKKELTLGEKRVHLNFNPSSDDKIGQFKKMIADAIDFCNNEMQANFKITESVEEAENNSEANRCFEIAMKDLESAQMFGVKGIAKTLNK